jgi:hypothetical protein
MQTYGDVMKKGNGEDEKTRYFRERIQATVSILERMLGHDIEYEMEMEMERIENQAYHRGQNLMMAERSLEEIRSANGHALEQEFSEVPKGGGIYRTPYGMRMLGVKEILEKFWTGE